MTITVKLFGPEAQAAGRREVVVQLAGERATCGELRRALGEAAAELRPHLPGCRFAVNHAFVGDDDAVAPGDEVAIIGKVSGG